MWYEYELSGSEESAQKCINWCSCDFLRLKCIIAFAASSFLIRSIFSAVRLNDVPRESHWGKNVKFVCGKSGERNSMKLRKWFSRLHNWHSACMNEWTNGFVKFFFSFSMLNLYPMFDLLNWTATNRTKSNVSQRGYFNSRTTQSDRKIKVFWISFVKFFRAATTSGKDASQKYW